jgi:1,4-alpha-glucan branching enzyme
MNARGGHESARSRKGVQAGRTPPSRISADDLYLFNQGNHYRAYEKFGAHLTEDEETKGCAFAVFAPNAKRVEVIGSFTKWKGGKYPLTQRSESGVFEGFVEGVKAGDSYKFHIESKLNGYVVDKSDPFAFFAEVSPATASIVCDLDHVWNDAEWIASRKDRHRLDQPLSIYEVHLGSWMRSVHEQNRFLSYREIAPRLVDYVREMGYTHVELMPVLEHPFYGSWGYQATGYFAATSRYGTPQDFMFFVESLHRAGIGVFLDWVPAHFPSDEAALGYFDGTYLFEHADPRKGFHPDWKSLIFNYGRPEVRSFLISSALFWLDKYHIDGLRVDAVASMLYLDYSRKEGEWIPNKYGGKEDLDAIDFLRQFNTAVYEHHPDCVTIAEESTSWPMVSRPAYVGGLGFGLKWDMGWMHDTLNYFKADPIFRKFQHNQVTFRNMYSDSENFVLALSHDEIVHGKGSLLRKMAGDEWQRYANLRLLYAWMFTQNGKKLLFQGSDFAQVSEWNHESELDWHLLADARHEGVRRLVMDLNGLYRGMPAMHERDAERSGFEWIDCADSENSVLVVQRNGKRTDDNVVVVLNMTPVPRDGYQLGVPHGGAWRVRINTDDARYGGSGYNKSRVFAAGGAGWHGRSCSISLNVPPLSALFLRSDHAEESVRRVETKP